jgi:hypothetical protein
MKKFITLGLLLISFCCEAESGISRESREIKMAEQFILLSSMRSASSEIREMCMKNRPYCEGTDQRELALALIGARNSESSLNSLAQLLRFSLDGAGGESRTCYILQNGEKIADILRSTSAEKLFVQCNREVAEVKKNAGFESVKTSNICAAKTEISQQKNDLLKAIKRSEKCDPGDF